MPIALLIGLTLAVAAALGTALLLHNGGDHRSTTIASALQTSKPPAPKSGRPFLQSPTGESASAIPSPTARLYAVTALDRSSGDVMLFGGADEAGIALADTWSWDGTVWRQLTPAASPPARAGATMAWSPDDRCLLLFGGSGPAAPGGGNAQSLFADTWCWKNNTWIQLPTVTAPSARGFATMATDDSAGDVILFGGEQGGRGETYLADTWIWSHSAWIERRIAAPPPARSRAGMSFDAAGAAPVMYGGQNVTGPLYDTLQWNGSSWVAALTSGTPPRVSSPVLASTGRDVVLVGPSMQSMPNEAVWRFAAGAWTELTPPTGSVGPDGRDSAAVAADGHGAEVVLFGGGHAGRIAMPATADTWIFDGRSWHAAR